MTTGRINQVAVFTDRRCLRSTPGLSEESRIGSAVYFASDWCTPVRASLNVPLSHHPRRIPSIRLFRLCCIQQQSTQPLSPASSPACTEECTSFFHKRRLCTRPIWPYPSTHHKFTDPVFTQAPHHSLPSSQKAALPDHSDRVSSIQASAAAPIATSAAIGCNRPSPAVAQSD